MTTEQGFRLVTRALAIYSLFWLVDEIVLAPTDVVGLVHHLRLLGMARDMGKYVSDETYWVRYYTELTCMRVIMAVLSLWMAMYFYRGGAALRKFFLPDTDPPSTE
jgi:hypothetical protein